MNKYEGTKETPVNPIFTDNPLDKPINPIAVPGHNNPPTTIAPQASEATNV